MRFRVGLGDSLDCERYEAIIIFGQSSGLGITLAQKTEACLKHVLPWEDLAQQVMSVSGKVLVILPSWMDLESIEAKLKKVPEYREVDVTFLASTS
jgi:hypothetical protein